MGMQTTIVIDNDGFSEFEKIAGPSLAGQVRQRMSGSDLLFYEGPNAGSGQDMLGAMHVMKSHPKHEAHVLIAQDGDLFDMHSSFVSARLKHAYPHTLKAEIERVELIEQHAADARAALDAKLAAQIQL